MMSGTGTGMVSGTGTGMVSGTGMTGPRAQT